MRNFAITVFAGVLGALAGACQRPCKNQSATVAPTPAAPSVAETPKEKVPPADPRSAALQEKISRFAVVPLGAKTKGLIAQQRAVLQSLIQASRFLDPIYDRQVWRRNPELARALNAEDSPWRKTQAEYAALMRGPWDRIDDDRPFATDQDRPAGGGMYPEDVTREDFLNYLIANPERRASLEHPHTTLTREERGWVARPYNRTFAQWLRPCAVRLRKAAGQTSNASLAKFLNARATALLDDNYYPSEIDWMDLNSRVAINIGPMHTNDDALMGLKAAYASYVTVSDPAAVAQVDRLRAHLPSLEQNLPLDDQFKAPPSAQRALIGVADLVFASGQARSALPAVAYELPKDSRARAERGTKTMILANVIRAQFTHLAKPVGEQVLVQEQRTSLSEDAFFYQSLIKELSREMGPRVARVQGQEQPVAKALGAHHAALQSAKAEVMGVYNLLYLTQKGLFQPRFIRPLLLTYFAELFRSARIGVDEAEGQSAALQLNFYFKRGVATWDPKQEAYRVRADVLEQGVRDLLKEILTIQALGRSERAQRLLAQLGVMSPAISRVLDKMGEIPVAIRPYYPLAGESGPPKALGWNEVQRKPAS